MESGGSPNFSVMILNALPSSYETFTVAMASREVLLTLEELKVKLISEETRQRESLGVMEYDDQEIGFVAKNSKKFGHRTRKESVTPAAKQDIQKDQDIQHY
ncbi:hypothetical protein RUM43_003860 [Polyplax serrata]|uniref:Uncharacterized protein n=1 Tax=Polyplax serrata TaxID=468196 RepID=A0AAN8SAD3_POLSC